MPTLKNLKKVIYRNPQKESHQSQNSKDTVNFLSIVFNNLKTQF